MIPEEEDDDPHAKTQSWNRQEKKSNLPFYLVIGAVCFLLAWVMSGAMK